MVPGWPSKHTVQFATGEIDNIGKLPCVLHNSVISNSKKFYVMAEMVEPGFGLLRNRKSC